MTRSEAGSAAVIRARLTHRISGATSGMPADALAVVESGPLPAATRIFVPGRIPCGECAACRRALCEACVAVRVTREEEKDGDARSQSIIEVPERFITAIGDDTMPPTRAIAAGLVAAVIGAAGRAGLGAGDTAIWLGEQALVRVGSSWSVGRGCRTFVWGGAVAPAALALPLEAGPMAWRTLIAEAEAAGGPAGGRPERRIFVCGAGDDLARAALDLVTPGSTLSFLRGAPASLTGLDAAPPLRILTGGAAHPDLIPEALATLRRTEVDVDGLFVAVTPGDEAAAVARCQRTLGAPIPIVELA
jgi:hypothetical protein